MKPKKCITTDVTPPASWGGVQIVGAHRTQGKRPRNTKPELTKADIERGLKLAGLMDDFASDDREVPYELLVEFCKTLNIVAEAAPFDPDIKWPDLKQDLFLMDASNRLCQFQSVYFGDKIEATRWRDNAPDWLTLIGDRIMDRLTDEPQKG